ncbi:DUF4328 domain-containing protein [Streptomyces sp. STR69]|uniref:DUF4328 domain-containing protein n=1 Tax=Streptomyces sp. STR69 TaxID=1796942 RepID=UPI0021CAE07F|nr:DUF4328 domain-containing protein [Streptomyces sp. STR69]
MSVPIPTPVPVSRLRSPVGLGRAAAALLGLVIAADLFAVYAGFKLYDVTGDLMNGATGGSVLRRADTAESLDSLAWKVHSGAMLVCVIVYVSWFVLVRGNAEVFDPAEQSMKSWWAVVGWFVPGLNLWYPRRITLEIWDASNPAGTRRSHLLVNVWWTLCLLTFLADRVGNLRYKESFEPDENHAVLQLSLLADTVEIVAAVLAILVVLRLTRMQHAKVLAGPGVPLVV